MQKVLFLDRDGVINDNSRKHVNKPEDLIVYENAKEALKKAYDAGYSIFVVTNQGGIELGHVSHEDMKKIHEKMIKDLEGICKIKDIEYCPYFKTKSNLRKPNPGMILKLAEKYNINLRESWMIGDMDTDIEAGLKAGCKTGKIGKKNKYAYVNGKDLLEVINTILKKE
ncbi:HAD family hydrolase [Clostridium sp. D2Q-11]|uniref:D,D-heptose 1,7-bisphosphate phosphatase n=1 Tax=Anaeromonas frigoriresistens TaxID=2683708 RepID=A0A942UUL6_9FIRM|nr:HAD family hydrolase [Anaeromonas frigoriresistens]MBS4539534.1 HAD family hydrolase [Anaeromonas frigoriresistens]